MEMIRRAQRELLKNLTLACVVITESLGKNTNWKASIDDVASTVRFFIDSCDYYSQIAILVRGHDFDQGSTGRKGSAGPGSLDGRDDSIQVPSASSGAIDQILAMIPIKVSHSDEIKYHVSPVIHAMQVLLMLDNVNVKKTTDIHKFAPQRLKAQH